MQADANNLHLVNVAKIIICGDNGTRPNSGWKCNFTSSPTNVALFKYI